MVKNTRKRRPLGQSTTVPARPLYSNHVWSDDFVHDETTDGRRLKCLTVLDEYTREGLTIDCLAVNLNKTTLEPCDIRARRSSLPPMTSFSAAVLDRSRVPDTAENSTASSPSPQTNDHMRRRGGVGQVQGRL